MKRNAFIMLLATVVVLGGVIGGAFAGGMAIGKGQGREEANQELQSRLSQFTSRFGQGGTQEGTQQETPQAPTQLPGGFGGLLGRGGTVGTVENVEGNIIILNTTEGAVRVFIADDTSIQRIGQGSLSDISPGENISVSGERKEDGSIEATTVFVMPDLQAR